MSGADRAKEVLAMYRPLFPGISRRRAWELHKLARFAFDRAAEVPAALRSPYSLPAWLDLGERDRLAVILAALDRNAQERAAAHNTAQAELSRRFKAQRTA